MARYEVMREAVGDRNLGAMRTDLIWVYGQEGIKVGAVNSYEHLAADYQARIEQAGANGHSTLDSWFYWSANGGNGYANVRTTPEVQEGPDTCLRIPHGIKKKPPIREPYQFEIGARKGALQLVVSWQTSESCQAASRAAPKFPYL
ncbi:MAG: hypothetical protein M1343_09910 [Chloroflexi bacterium]|nr:hypothetical protein [Chloroflexota bacterium]